jgi:hypothetical protein
MALGRIAQSRTVRNESAIRNPQSAIRNPQSAIKHMAGFRTHIGVSSALGIGYAGTLHTMYGVPMETATVAGALCGFAGMLPDLDSDYGVPLREAMSFAAATIPVLLVNRFESLRLDRDQIVIISIGLYLFVRFGIGTMIRKFTVHRGMFHSIPAMLILGGIVFLLTGASPTNDRLMMAGGAMGGFLSHLVLDEIYSVEFKSGRWRRKKSFGTALKLWGGDTRSNIAAYGKLAVVGMGVVGEPTMFKDFIANRPQLAEAIDMVTKIGQSDPKLAAEVDQLKNILGNLNNNPGASSAPQNGGAWSSGPPAPPNAPYYANNQNPYQPQPSATPATNTAPTNQHGPAPSLPPQQLPTVAPINNQRPDWQWPGGTHSYPDTAQRSMGQYPQ